MRSCSRTRIGEEVVGSGGDHGHRHFWVGSFFNSVREAIE